MLTHDMRENRCLHNLARNAALTRRQLWCASVNNAALETLEQADAIRHQGDEVGRDEQTGEIFLADEYKLTPAGEQMLHSRIANGDYSTIGANA